MKTEKRIHALYLELLKIAEQAQVELSPETRLALREWVQEGFAAGRRNLRTRFRAVLPGAGKSLRPGDLPSLSAFTPLEPGHEIEMLHAGGVSKKGSFNSLPFEKGEFPATAGSKKARPSGAFTIIPPKKARSRSPEPDPPRKSFGLVNSPDCVVVGREFPVVVGLSPSPQPGVFGGALERPDSSVGPYRLTVQLVAEGFRLRPEGSRRELQVTAGKPYPRALFHLIPEPQSVPIRSTAIQILFSIEGQTIGAAFRPIAVIQPDAEALKPVGAVEPGVELPVADRRSTPDLTIRISTPEHDGRLLWTFETRFADLAVPTEPIRTHLGREPREFTRWLDERLQGKEGRPGLDAFLAGVGDTIADAMPAALWPLLREVAKRAGEPPRVLLLSEEPHVPWELATIDGPWIDPRALPILAAQARTGRWILGNRRPTMPPTRHSVQCMAVISGSSARARLEQAESEAVELTEQFGATRIEASAEPVHACLSGRPAVDLLHFAVHGLHDPDGPRDGLILADGQTLDPLEVRGHRLDRAPFVFLNACQAGTGHRQLGGSAGLAASFLAAGASAVVAPLWSVWDGEARRIALEFYDTVKVGERPSEAIRSTRRSPHSNGSATHLAYQFFGHPDLRLEFSRNGESLRD